MWMVTFISITTLMAPQLLVFESNILTEREWWIILLSRLYLVKVEYNDSSTLHWYCSTLPLFYTRIIVECLYYSNITSYKRIGGSGHCGLVRDQGRTPKCVRRLADIPWWDVAISLFCAFCPASRHSDHASFVVERFWKDRLLNYFAGIHAPVTITFMPYWHPFTVLEPVAEFGTRSQIRGSNLATSYSDKEASVSILY